MPSCVTDTVSIETLPGKLYVASLKGIGWLCKGAKDGKPVCEHTYPVTRFLSYLKSRTYDQPACTLCHTNIGVDKDEESEAESSTTEEEESIEEEEESIEDEPKGSGDDDLVDLRNIMQVLHGKQKHRPKKYIRRSRGTYIEDIKKRLGSLGALNKYAEFVWVKGGHAIFVTRWIWTEEDHYGIVELVEKMYEFSERSHNILSVMRGYNAMEQDQDFLRYPDKYPADFFDPLQPLQLVLAWHVNLNKQAGTSHTSADMNLVGIATFRDNLFRGGLKEWLRNRLESYGVFIKHESEANALVNFLHSEIAGGSRLDYGHVEPLKHFLRTNRMTFTEPKQGFHIVERAIKRPVITAKTRSIEDYGKRPTNFELAVYDTKNIVFAGTPHLETYYYDEMMVSKLPGSKLTPTEGRGWGVIAARDFKVGEVVTGYFVARVVRTEKRTEEDASYEGSHAILLYSTETHNYYVDGKADDPKAVEALPNGDKLLGSFCNEATELKDLNVALVVMNRVFLDDTKSTDSLVVTLMCTRPINKGDELLTYYSTNYKRHGYSINYTWREYTETLFKMDVVHAETRIAKKQRLREMRKWSVLINNPAVAVMENNEKGLDMNESNILRVFKDFNPAEPRDLPFYSEVQRPQPDYWADPDVYEETKRKLRDQTVNVGKLHPIDEPSIQGIIYQMTADESDDMPVISVMFETIQNCLLRDAARLERFCDYSPLVHLFVDVPSMESLSTVRTKREKMIKRLRTAIESGIDSKEVSEMVKIQQEAREQVRKYEETYQEQAKKSKDDHEQLRSLQNKVETLSSSFSTLDFTSPTYNSFMFAEAAKEIKIVLEQADGIRSNLSTYVYKQQAALESAQIERLRIEEIELEIAKHRLEVQEKMLKKREDLEELEFLQSRESSEEDHIQESESELQNLGFSQKRARETFTGEGNAHMARMWLSENLRVNPIVSTHD